jgi:hypothetical protein
VFGELLVLFRGIDADRVVGNVELPDGVAALTERLALGRSPAGEGFREPREHDDALACVIGETMSLAVRALKVEWRSNVSDLQFRARLLSEADQGGRERKGDACRD